MKKILCTLLVSCAAFVVQAQNNNNTVAVTQSEQTNKVFHSFWELMMGAGTSINSQFIPSTQNIWVPAFTLRAVKQLPNNLLGIGYDANVLALKNTDAGTPMYNEKKNFGNPQHSLYVFADKVWRKQNTYIYAGLLAGLSFGKACSHDTLSEFTSYESSKGYVLGGHIGMTYKMNKQWNLFAEFEPKVYGINFAYTQNGVSQTSVPFRIKAFPFLVGFKYALN